MREVAEILAQGYLRHGALRVADGNADRTADPAAPATVGRARREPENKLDVPGNQTVHRARREDAARAAATGGDRGDRAGDAVTADASRTATVTTLLHDHPVAQKLVVCWAIISGSPADSSTVIEWAAVAGVPRSTATRVAVMLFRNGICRADHTVDPAALRVVQHQAAERLRSSSRRQR
jgi:hypothetical protein